MFCKGSFLKGFSIIVTLTFLWTNCVLAAGQLSVSADKMAAQTQVVDVLRDARVVYTGTALHSVLVSQGIADLKALYENQDGIREKLRETIGDAADKLKTLIFQGKEGGTSYYTFTPEGYFYRFTTMENVDDAFYHIIKRYAKTEQVGIGDGEYYLQVIPTSPEFVDLIETSVKEIYPEGVFTKYMMSNPRYQDIAKLLYSQMKDSSKVYTLEEVISEYKISRAESEIMLDWLSSIDRETETNEQFKGIEKITRGGKTVYQWLNPDSINPDIFRDYDYRSPTRGSFDFSPKKVFFMTLTWASMALEKRQALGIDNNKVVIARDCRKTPKEVIEAMIKAVEYSGLQAIFVGEKYNCAASYAWAVRKHSPLMGIFLTASHMKGEDVVGAKVSIRGRSGELESLTTKEIKEVSRRRLDEILRDTNRLGLIRDQRIERVVDDVEPTYLQMATTVGLVASGNFKSWVGQQPTLYDLATDLEKAGNILEELSRYKGMVDEQAKPFAGLRVVIEAAHTPSGKLARDVYEALGAEVIVLNEEILELAGQHKADPSDIGNLDELMNKMQETGAHLGLAFDLDGDRGAIVIPTPEIDSITKMNFAVLPPDNLMQALLPFFDKRGYCAFERGKVAVVRDVLSTKGVDKKAEQIGYESFQTDAGYVYLKAKVRSLKEKGEGYTVPIYAERSGHVWTHATGAFEDPIVVSLFFAIMGVSADNDFSKVFQENTVPYKQSTRFQPLFGKKLLRELSSDPQNDTGWVFGKGKPPMKIISMGRHRAIERLREVFQAGARFNTPAGELVVSEFNFYYDEEAGINRYADIRFALNGQDAGSFVFRASSNDPTFVCSFETPLLPGETFDSNSVKNRHNLVGGVVLDWLEKEDYGIVSGTGFDYPNNKDAEGALLGYRFSCFSGLPISLDLSTGEISLGDGLDSEPRWERPLKDAGNSIADPSIISQDPERVVYYGYRNARMASDKAVIDGLKLRFDITVLLPGVIGEEFIMTKGHIHPGNNYPEFYEVWNGTALFIQQGISANTGKFEVIATLAKPGDKVLLIPGYSHRTVNISDTPLVIANWICEEVGGKKGIEGSSKVEPYFKEIEAKNGYAYHVIKGTSGSIVLRHNPKYGDVPADIRFALPVSEISELGLSNREPMYMQFNNRKLAAFLRDSRGSEDLFQKAFNFIDADKVSQKFGIPVAVKDEGMAGREDPSISDLKEEDIRDRVGIVRVGTDVLDKKGKIKSDNRIRILLPTIKDLFGRGAKNLVLCAYFGRPARDDENKDQRYAGELYDNLKSGRPIASRLAELTGRRVHFISAVDGEGVFSRDYKDYFAYAQNYIALNVQPGEIIFLDNLRFWDEEDKKDAEGFGDFANRLAGLGDFFVQECYPQSHRPNSTVVSIVEHFKGKAVFGNSYLTEIKYFNRLRARLNRAERGPVNFVLAGVKIETKPGVISKITVAKKLLDKFRQGDYITLGGALAYTFIIAQYMIGQGLENPDDITEETIRGLTGNSYVQRDLIPDALFILKRAKEKGVIVLMPVDHRTTNKIDDLGNIVFSGKKLPEDADIAVTSGNIPVGRAGVDIGPETEGIYIAAVKRSETILIAGPLGVFEDERAAQGSINFVKAMGEVTAGDVETIAAGGETEALVAMTGVRLSHVSTGGGAALEDIEKDGNLPGSIAVRKNRPEEKKADTGLGGTQGSHLVRDVREVEEGESLVFGITIDENGRLQDSEDSRMSLLQGLLDRLAHIYGPGIFAKIREVQVVRSLKGERLYPQGRAPLASYRDGVLKIDNLLFGYNKYIVFEEVEHEFSESIAGIIPGCNEILADVVSTYRSVLRFLEPNMGVTDDKYKWDEDEYRERILSILRDSGNPIDPDGEYLKLLWRLRELKNRNQLSKDEIIASVVRYVLRTKLYEIVRAELGLPSELAKQIRDLDPGLDDMLQVLNEIKKAKEGEELVDRVKETSELAITAVETFTGLRIEGLDKISDELARMISAEARQVSSLNKVAGIVAKADEIKYILVSEERLDELIRIIGEDEYRSIERRLQGNGYLIRTEIPQGVSHENIVRLRDPADELKPEEQIEGMSYLSIPYTRTAFYMAADIVRAKGKIRDINPLILNLIFDLYHGLRELPQGEQELFFTQPWHQIILDNIRPVIVEINNLRKAVAIIEKAA